MKSKEVIIVNGNNTLTGSVEVSGAKNSALKLIAASILGNGKSTITNVPDISDIHIICKVLQQLGAIVEFQNNTVSIDTSTIDKFQTDYELVSKMRASIAVLGPLLARFGKAKVALPGGCRIGARKIDMHLIGLKNLGVEFKVEYGYLIGNVKKHLNHSVISLEFPSVGATENILMAACVAKGTTIIYNAACEPEIKDLANMLNLMGAKIKGAGSNTIIIEGVDVDKMHPCTYKTCPDRIEAGTFLIGGALSSGPLSVCNISREYLNSTILKLKSMGLDIDCTSNSITISRNKNKKLNAIDIQTLPHPGFPTDLQAQIMLLCTQAYGVSVITENVFENRFMFAEEIKRMGANVTLKGHRAYVKGPVILSGAPVYSTDLRAGASLVLAGIIANGQTIVRNIGHIDRGYENFCYKLKKLGADVCRKRIDNK